MMEQRWNRRRFLQGVGSALTVGTVTPGLAMPFVASVQERAGSAPGSDVAICVTTTKDAAWQVQAWAKPGWRWDTLNLNVDPSATAQTMEGFGGCFNELGWTSLSKLSDGDRESVLRELFDPVAGARFSLCRMPIGANDFALKAYSYDETKDDFELKHFSIDNDRATDSVYPCGAAVSAEAAGVGFAVVASELDEEEWILCRGCGAGGAERQWDTAGSDWA
jgi:glucosylceramidase